MKNNNRISSNNLDKANMFNDYFFEKFSNESTYDVDIDFSNDDMFDIDFSCTRVKQFLDNININKAPGPDGIHGCVLKFAQLVYADLYLSYSDCHITLGVYLQNGNMLILYLFTKKGRKILLIIIDQFL